MPPDVIVDKPEVLASALAGLFEREEARARRARGAFAVALTGGSVGTRFFPALARARCDWRRTEFFWGDERAVPPDHPDSNFGAARSMWLERAGVPPERIHRMKGEAGDLRQAAAEYSAELLRLVGDPPRLDLVLLGVGPDGHVCSLFPGHPLLGEQRLWVAAIDDSPKPPPRRLTLTLPTLTAAELVVIVALGASKSKAMRETFDAGPSSLPVATVAHRDGRTVVLMDPAAAGDHTPGSYR